MVFLNKRHESPTGDCQASCRLNRIDSCGLSSFREVCFFSFDVIRVEMDDLNSLLISRITTPTIWVTFFGSYAVDS